MTTETPETTDALFDLDTLLSQLKPFQRATVDHAFRRLWTDEEPTDLFLVADEVGLGKTLIAKGLAARAIDHLRAPRRTVTVVYISSNSQIAAQNLERLRDLTGGQAQQNADRITMLPQTMGQDIQGGVQLIAFTPGTSLRLGNSTGRVEERVLMHWMLSHLLDRTWLLQDDVIEYFRVGVGAEKFLEQLEAPGRQPELDSELIRDFFEYITHERGRFGGTLLEGLLEELDAWLSDDPVSDEMYRRRTIMIGELRMAMAQVSVRRLAPDLVILDEFQRFKDLFPGARSGEDVDGTDAQRLAQQIITHRGTKCLVLSATPYKMFTLPDEPDEEDHHQDFHDTISFLAGPGPARQVAEHLAEVRRGMLQGTENGQRAAMAASQAATAVLRLVMSRTERVGAGRSEDGMLQEMAIPSLTLHAQDLEVWTANERIARHVHGMDMFEYWRSSPYPVNFMDPSSYLPQRRVMDLASSEDPDPELAAILHLHRRGLLDWNDIRQFRELDPGNAKLRAMIDGAMDRGIWKLAWLPPSLPYTTPGGPFASDGARAFTKRLVFSAWSVVPKAIAALFSYEADRRLSDFAPRSVDGSPAQYNSSRSTRPLDFAIADGKLRNLPHLALLHPSVALARLGDPLEIAREAGAELPVDPATLVEKVAARIQRVLDTLDLPTGEVRGQTSGWYGVAPYLLDRALGVENHRPLSTLGSDEQQEEATSRYTDHAGFALAPDLDVLGAPPEDLAQVLAKVAVAGPGVCALRAIGRSSGTTDLFEDRPVRRAALRIGEGFRSLLQRREIVAAVRAATDSGPEEPEKYWQSALQYCLDGNLQSMLDEYVHTLDDSLGLTHEDSDRRAEELADKIRSTASIRTVVNEVHELSSVKTAIDVRTHRINSHIAARFGQKTGSEQFDKRGTSVRDSFNSPFWPFILASTSVGQEGLDFHTYSHAIVHWNLPANPVDLEQREGRVHRYKGHAIRKNIAAKHSGAALAGEHFDPWTAMFRAAEDAEPEGSDGMRPFWVYEGPAKIERYVPAMPLSRESRRYRRLKHTLGAYRSVMGQPRQGDLISPTGDWADWPTINLRPPPNASP